MMGYDDKLIHLLRSHYGRGAWLAELSSPCPVILARISISFVKQCIHLCIRAHASMLAL